jgi:hypothetical protein
MGRETKILLTLLGLLAGVFMGVVSMKLFVPRPPEGAGPDVHGDFADLETQPLVEPPDLDRLPPARSSEPASPDSYATRTSRFSQPPLGDEPEPPVQPASFQAAEPINEILRADASADLLPPPSEIVPPSSRPPGASPPGLTPAVEATVIAPPPAFAESEARAEPAPPERAEPPPTAVMTGSGYVARPGDSWWSLAERAYGDGRLYRALFAWNRRLDPRVSLQPGTRLEIPQPDRLAAAWPTLMPHD